MCLIADASTFGDLLAVPATADAAPIHAWLQRGGTLVYSTGGRLGVEVERSPHLKRKLLDYVRAGRARLIPPRRVRRGRTGAVGAIRSTLERLARAGVGEGKRHAPSLHAGRSAQVGFQEQGDHRSPERQDLLAGEQPAPVDPIRLRDLARPYGRVGSFAGAKLLRRKLLASGRPPTVAWQPRIRDTAPDPTIAGRKTEDAHSADARQLAAST